MKLISDFCNGVSRSWQIGDVDQFERISLMVVKFFSFNDTSGTRPFRIAVTVGTNGLSPAVIMARELTESASLPRLIGLSHQRDEARSFDMFWNWQIG